MTCRTWTAGSATESLHPGFRVAGGGGDLRVRAPARCRGLDGVGLPVGLSGAPSVELPQPLRGLRDLLEQLLALGVAAGQLNRVRV